MALFFDQEWFDGQMRRFGLSRETVAAALGLARTELNEIWKDQRELTARNVAILAALLGTSVREIAERAGVSTPIPAASAAPSPTEIAERIARIEERLSNLEKRLDDKP